LNEPHWLSESLVLALHERVIAQTGGSHGVLNQALLESALNRPLQRATYDAEADLFRLAAAYAFGICKNHPFIDGNKRTGLLVIFAFLSRNGIDFDPGEDEGVDVAVRVASGQMGEVELADWIRRCSSPQAN
jgi:death-on-curing protein